MTECNMCGDCCEKIPLFATKRELLALENRTDSDAESISYIVKHWKRINKNDPRYKEIFGVDRGKGYLYECEMFDAETRLCKDHENRPPVCRGYPWYNRPVPDKDPFLAKRCSFWEDVPVEIKMKSFAFVGEKV